MTDHYLELEQEVVRLRASLTAVSAEKAQLKHDLEESRKDWMYHSDCRPNRQKAWAAMADAKALADWRADVTVALQRPGGCHFEDVPKYIRDLVAEVAEVSRRLAQVTQELADDRALVFAIATESADELVNICGVNPSDDSARLNYLAELFAPEPDTAQRAPEQAE